MTNRTLTINFDSTVLKTEYYESFAYPGGEWQVRLTPECYESITKEPDQKLLINLIARLNNPTAIVKCVLLCQAIAYSSVESGKKWYNHREFNLILPYLPYGRADRAFTKGDCFGLEAFAHFFRDYVDNIYTLDKHSDALNDWDIVRSVSPKDLILKAIQDVVQDNPHNKKEVVILFPDAGAKDRYAKDFEYIESALSSNGGGKIDLIKYFCEKDRDPITGKLLGFKVPKKEILLDQAFCRSIFIIDDICDGGGTFLGIAKQIVEDGKADNLYLYVTHGIFSKGMDELYTYFTKIFSSNSYYGYFETGYPGKYDSVTPILKQIAEDCK